MTLFKNKASKYSKPSKRATTTTLDAKHQEFVDKFHQQETVLIPHLMQEKQRLRTLLKTQSDTVSLEEQLEWAEQIKEIKDAIRTMKEQKATYYLDNSAFIVDYFETKKNIEQNTVPIASSASNMKNNRVRQMFRLETPAAAANTVPLSYSMPSSSPSMPSSSSIHRYFLNVNSASLDMTHYTQDTSVCASCGKGELILLEEDGVMSCNRCAVNVPVLIEHEKPSFKEPPKEVCYYAYKRINHFKEILAQFQAKETTQISEAAITCIRNQIKKERMNVQTMSHESMKEMLKKLGYSKHYEHINFILNKLGVKPPVLTVELEEQLCSLFMDIQVPHARACPQDRINFLHYYYVLYKFFELLGETQYLSRIPLLKEREIIIEQDETWKKICQDLHWEFIRTI